MGAVTAPYIRTAIAAAAVKEHLGAADAIVDTLPWVLGTTDRQRRLSRGKVSALTHQIAGLLAGGWSDTEIRTALADAATAADAPDSASQERQWRSALNRAKNNRRPAGNG